MMYQGVNVEGLEAYSQLMRVMDQINARMGRGTLKLASEGFKQPWKMKQGNKSPNYTTYWDELICVMK